MTSLQAYLPQDRLRALARGAILPDRTTGTALFADLSGFTLLTEKLTRDLGARRGAEELTRQINEVFNALIAQVEHSGGSVIGFAGDAMTCWFDNQHTSAPSSKLAVACALSLQAAMHTFPHLALKVAVASGVARRMVVGDPQVQLFDVLAGAPLTHTALGERLAHQGEVVVDEATALLIAAPITDWRTDSETGLRFGVVGPLSLDPQLPPTPQPIDFAPDELRAWIHPALYERALSVEGAFLAEFRSVTLVFLRFSGIDYDSDAAPAQLDAYVRWGQSIAHHYDGFMRAPVIGDKGSYLLIAFGAPLAHENDPHRALQAALALSQPPAECAFIIGTQIGVAKGIVWAGACGGTSRHGYDFIGDDVNLAARLMEVAASGEILVSGRMQASVADHFECEPRPTLRLKGKAQPVPVYRLLTAPVSHHRHTHFHELIGRQAELDILRTSLQTLMTSLPDAPAQTILISGEAGIGKSHLVEQLLYEAERRQVPVFYSGGDAVEKSTPYYAWREIFNQRLGLEAVSEPADRRQQVLALLHDAPDWQQRAPLLNNLLALELPDNALTAQMSGQVRADNTHDLLLYLLSTPTHAPRPQVIVLDDAHWLDSASWALVVAVSQRVPHLLLVLATRPLADPVPLAYRQLANAPTTHTLHLETLSPYEAVTLVCRRLQVRALPDPVATLIRDKAAGHPFFSEELAYALRDRGMLRIDQGECYLAAEAGSLQTLSFPDTVQGVVTSRIDRLPPAQQLTLKVASVVGQIFTYRLLHEIHPLETDRDDVLGHLEALHSLDIAHIESPDPDLSYIFKHVITREVAYDLMIYAQRRALHQKIAEWHETTFTDLTPHYPILAHHWQQAEVPEKAVAYLDKAGEEALRVYANWEATEFFSTAHKLDTPALTQSGSYHSRLSRRYRLWGEALYRLGHLSDSRSWLERSLIELNFPVPRNNFQMGVILVYQLGRQLFHRLRTTPARPPLSPNHAVTERLTKLKEAFQIYELLADVYFFTNAPVLTIWVELIILNEAEALSLYGRELAYAYAALAFITSLIPLPALVQRYQRQAMLVTAQLNHPYAAAPTYFLLSLINVGLGHWQAAQNLIEQYTVSYEKLGDWRQLGLGLTAWAMIDSCQGQFESSYAKWQAVYHLAVRTHNQQQKAWGLYGQAYCLMRVGQLAEALPLAREAVKWLSPDDLAANIIAYGVLAEVEWRCGLSDVAVANAKIALEKIETVSTPSNASTLLGYIGVATVCLSVLEAPAVHPQLLLEAQVAAQKIHTALRAYARVFPIGQPWLLFYQSQLEVLKQKSAKAQAALRQCLVQAEQKGMPYELGLAHQALGQLASGDEKQQHLTQAQQIFSQLQTPLITEH